MSFGVFSCFCGMSANMLPPLACMFLALILPNRVLGLALQSGWSECSGFNRFCGSLLLGAVLVLESGKLLSGR